MASAFATYLEEMGAIRRHGASPETSYYTPLQNLINELGRQLKPKVLCVGQIPGAGAGTPDFGLYTLSQLGRGKPHGRDLSPTLPPDRGVIEAKPPERDFDGIVRSEQVRRYWERYGLVLVTNYRCFLLVGRDEAGRDVELEHIEVAPDAEAFWELCAHPGRARKDIARRVEEFVRRVLLHRAVLTQPKDVAWFLASYARDALARVEAEPDLPAFLQLKEALEEALGMAFDDKRGAHFFHSTLVQTLFYGVFSAWILWCKTDADPAKRQPFNDRTAAWHLRLPVLQQLFHAVNDPFLLGRLKLQELVEWAAMTLRRVDEKAFFARFQDEHAVQYFYEPFLEAFDSELRKSLGVWYTPPEVVDYMVERVDSVLREELAIADGLADNRVFVLDPCCGTGSYLVAVLRRIERTLRAKGEDALVAAELKRAAMERVFGFELLPAPFVVAHFQLSLLLEQLGAPLGRHLHHGTEMAERAAVYLTNALTGWGPPPAGAHQLHLLAGLQEEADYAREVKREKPIIVVLGNPPYNGFAGVAVAEERQLSAVYRSVKRVRPPEGQGLNDLYVRFFRMAERRIVEQSQRGIVCFISNYSWLDGLSFTGMRERYLEVFDKIWIDNLHGDRIISEVAPDGRASETVFAIGGKSPGIKVGTSVSLFVRKERASPVEGMLYYRDLHQSHAAERRVALLKSAHETPDNAYRPLRPAPELGLPFKIRHIAGSYLEWPHVFALFPVSFPGIKTSRDEALVDIDHWRLMRRMERYFDDQVSNESIAQADPGLMRDTGAFDAKATREILIARGFLEENVVRYYYRPFDVRWLYWESETKLLDRNRADYFSQIREGNLWLSAGNRNRRDVFYRPQVTARPADHHVVESNVAMFPLYERGHVAGNGLSHGKASEWKPNVPSSVQAVLDGFGADASDLFMHVIAILHASAYESDNIGPLRQDWPRIPLPAKREALLLASATLGRQVAALLDPETPVDGVTAGNLRAELVPIGLVSHRDRGSLGARELELDAGWGHAGQGGVTMPGRGIIEARPYIAEERRAIAKGAEALGLSFEEALACLGSETCDVYLNRVAYWRSIPRRVWDYTLGGYQVIKKWLSYREHALLGRALTLDEARHVTAMARRIAALLLLEPRLDANYRATAADAYPWPKA